MMLYAALLHYNVRHMPAWNFGVDSYVFVPDGAEPNVMVAFAVPDKRTSVFLENGTDEFFIFGHYEHTSA